MGIESKRKRERRPPEERREQILAAAARVFTAKGLSKATMDDVATEAGVAKGTLYLYFDSKEQLLLGLGNRYTEEIIHRSGGILLEDGGSGALISRFDGFLEDMIGYYVERRELHRVLFHGGAVSEAESLRRFRELLQHFIAKGVESGEFRIPDVGFTADYLLGGLHAALIPVLHEPTPDRERFLLPARELVRRTLGIC